MPEKNTYSINPSCKNCNLHERSRTVCFDGCGTASHKPLLLYAEAPDYFADHTGKPFGLDVGSFLDWLISRMCLSRLSVAYDYIYRCYTKNPPRKKVDRASIILECNEYRFANLKKIKPKAIVTLGQVPLEALTGKSQVKDFAERKVRAWEGVVRKYVEHVWCTYSPNYPIVGDPGASVEMYRTIFMAAKEAGLNPKPVTDVKPFIWTKLL